MFDQILSVLFPERCRSCNKNGAALCSDCLTHIRPASSIFDDIPSFAFFDYGDKIVQKAIWELKYHRKSPVAKILTEYGGPEIHEFLNDVAQSATSFPIILVPVPQHYTKTFSRGFNQSKLIASWLLPLLPGATIQTILRKNRATDAQARTHDRHERQKNLAHSMYVQGEISKKVLYIIIDDVITTGSTIHEASRALRAAGAKHICAIALAHGYAQRL